MANTNFTVPTPKASTFMSKSNLDGYFKRVAAYEFMCNGHNPKTARKMAQHGQTNMSVQIEARKKARQKKKEEKKDA